MLSDNMFLVMNTLLNDVVCNINKQQLVFLNIFSNIINPVYILNEEICNNNNNMWKVVNLKKEEAIFIWLWYLN